MQAPMRSCGIQRSAAGGASDLGTSTSESSGVGHDSHFRTSGHPKLRVALRIKGWTAGNVVHSIDDDAVRRQPKLTTRNPKMNVHIGNLIGCSQNLAKPKSTEKRVSSRLRALVNLLTSRSAPSPSPQPMRMHQNVVYYVGTCYLFYKEAQCDWY